MNAAAILARAEAAGVTVEADGPWLRLSAATPPPTALMHELADVKAELLELLEERGFERQERAALLAVPPWPLPGTPERDRIDQQQARLIAGLLAVADPQRWNISRP